MSLEIPAEAERMKLLLPHAEYRRWWIEHVTRQTVAKPADDEAD